MSVIVASSGAPAPSGTALELYDEKPITPTPPAAQGDNSVAIGSGAATIPSATNSIALGHQSLARHRGALVYANGRFSSTGDNQVGKYLLSTITVNGTETEAYLNGTAGGERLVIPDNSTWTFTATATGHRTDAGDGHAGYKIEGVIYRQAGVSTVALQGAPIKTVLAESDVVWDINIIADTTNGSLTVKVTGQTGKIIRWVVLIDTLEVTN